MALGTNNRGQLVDDNGRVIGFKNRDNSESLALCRVTNGAIDLTPTEVRNAHIAEHAALDLYGTRHSDYSTAMQKWRLAFAKTIYGLGDSKVLVVGDSSIAGSGSTGVSGYNNNTRAGGMPVQLARMFQNRVCEANADGFIGASIQANYANYDYRFTNDGNWTTGNSLNNAIGGAFRTAVAGAVSSVTPSKAWTHAIVYYAQSATQGTFGVGINGGSLTAVNANGSNAMPSVTVSNTTPGLNTLNLVKNNATSINILGFQFYDSTKSQVRIIPAAWPGGKAADLSPNANPWDGTSQITAVAPDLTIIDCTINDWNAATTIGDSVTAGTYIYQINLMVQAAKVTGSVLLVSGAPSSISGNAALAVQQTYVDALSTYASANGCAFLDNWRRMISYELATAFYSDALHRKYVGYADYAATVFKAIGVI